MTPLDLPSIYVRVVRLAEVGRDHLFVGGPHRDRITLELPGGRVATEDGLSVATRTEHTGGAPLIEPGWYPDALTVDLHKGRRSLTNFGTMALSYRRPGGDLVLGDYRGLNLHTWRGRSDGCITVPEWWMPAALAALQAHGIRYQSGRTFGLLVEAPHGPHR